MLIVNADDFGRNQLATDRILYTFAKSRITSSSAMMFMVDSERAAKIAIADDLPVGLHINLTETFSSPSAPPKLIQAQNRVSSFLKRSKYALLIYQPFLRRCFETLIAGQIAEFLRLYDRQPSHFDGHQHMHLASNVLLARLLPQGTNVRRSFSFRSGEKGAFNRLYRKIVDGALVKRHRTTDSFFSLSHYMDTSRLATIVALAYRENVELMTHP